MAFHWRKAVLTIVHITYHDETNIGSCPIGQTGGFENADGNGEIHVRAGTHRALRDPLIELLRGLRRTQSQEFSDASPGQALGARGEALIAALQEKLETHRLYVEREGEDMPEITNWRWTGR